MFGKIQAGQRKGRPIKILYRRSEAYQSRVLPKEFARNRPSG
jgi:hypothetical protein